MHSTEVDIDYPGLITNPKVTAVVIILTSNYKLQGDASTTWYLWHFIVFVLMRMEWFMLTLKEPGFLDPSHSRGGFHPPKISETDWWNIKCVVLVDSYDPPESIGTKKSINIPCMTPQWRHKWRHVKNTKITQNRQNHGFSLFFQAKVAFFWQWCVSKYAYTCSYYK